MMDDCQYLNSNCHDIKVSITKLITKVDDMICEVLAPRLSPCPETTAHLKHKKLHLSQPRSFPHPHSHHQRQAAGLTFPVPHSKASTNAHSLDNSGVAHAQNQSLPTFGGDLLEWQLFWDSFNTAINRNIGLSGVQKFTYLRG